MLATDIGRDLVTYNPLILGKGGFSSILVVLQEIVQQAICFEGVECLRLLGRLDELPQSRIVGRRVEDG